MNEGEAFASWTHLQKSSFCSEYVEQRDKKIQSAIKKCDLVHIHNPGSGGCLVGEKREKTICDDSL